MWVLDEDNALKRKIQNFGSNPFLIPNYSDGRLKSIAVYFRIPDPEERTRTFPHIAIDLIAIEPDPTRAHRANGFIVPNDTETATPQTGFTLVADDMPLPYTLVYQLVTYARTPTDDRWMQILMTALFPDQFGFLDMSEFDQSARRADFISSVRRDTVDENTKRLYRVIHTVNISSQLYLYQINQIQQLTSTALTLENLGNEPLVTS